jgi:hypothetical protein
MRLPALKHLIESVASLAHSEQICVLGSSSLLGSFPELGESGGPLELTFDADLLVQPCDEQLAAMLHEAVGEGSLFAQRTGYHADILRPEIQETLPDGWAQRLVPVDAARRAVALDPVDLLVIKLRTGRPKDLQLCKEVITKGLISPVELRARLDHTTLAEHEVVQVYRRLSAITG